MLKTQFKEAGLSGRSLVALGGISMRHVTRLLLGSVCQLLPLVLSKRDLPPSLHAHRLWGRCWEGDQRAPAAPLPRGRPPGALPALTAMREGETPAALPFTPKWQTATP